MPSGKAALHPLWPEARWNVSGLFVRGRLLYDLKRLLEDRFGCRLNFENVHGAPAVPWNAGRISHVPLQMAALPNTIRMFNEAGIGVFYTFTNHLLEEEDLAEPTCNQMLDLIDNGRGLNGVILVSELLYDHLRREHPELKLTASVVKSTLDGGRGNLDYYRRQSERFESVMVHPDDALDFELLSQLDREKTEILVNENCGMNCDHRPKDYQLTAVQHRDRNYSDGLTSPVERQRKARCRQPQRRLDPKRRPCSFTTQEMKRAYDAGFRRFKLQGRQDSAEPFLYDVLRYTVESDLVLPVLLKSFFSGRAAEHIAALSSGTRPGRGMI